jgi:serine protease Do
VPNSEYSSQGNRSLAHMTKRMRSSLSFRGSGCVVAWWGLTFCLTPTAALALAATGSRIGPLNEFSRSIRALVVRVSPSVVQVLVTRYGPKEENGRASAVVGRQQALGSGVIVDPSGYIMTNAHVVENAQQIRVRLVSKGGETVPSVISQSYAPLQNARLVGSFKEGDLALLKIDATDLPALPFADYAKLRQGEIVFVFGSPAGLQNSMSMGMVSSIARQLDPDSPFLYIQTDAPVNHGDSGGPLINAAGEVVGLNTFIMSESGGNEGLGFAIPSSLLRWVYEQLRAKGHVDRPFIGAGLQTVTPTLAAALRLPRDSGVLVSDILPGSPAEAAGLKIGDLLLSVDGMELDNVAEMMRITFRYGAGQHLRVEALRGKERLSFDVVPVQAPHEVDRLADLADPAKSLIPRLGILGIAVNRQTEAIVDDLRWSSGVIVAGRVESTDGTDAQLEAGDVIHEINGNAVLDVEGLRSAVRQLKPGDPVALQIEREGKLLYRAFQME